MRAYAFLPESYAVRRLSLSSSSSTTRCTYGLFRAAWAAPIAPAPALAAFFFFDAMALLEIGGFGLAGRTIPGVNAPSNPLSFSARVRRPARLKPDAGGAPAT